ncbi:hypothetical protein [Streptomyces decoyicus]
MATPTDAVETAIGPRSEGAYYGNTTGLYEVIAVHRGLEAQLLLGKDATWAITTRHLATERIETHRQPWTTTDQLVRRGQQ